MREVRRNSMYMNIPIIEKKKKRWHGCGLKRTVSLQKKKEMIFSVASLIECTVGLSFYEVLGLLSSGDPIYSRSLDVANSFFKNIEEKRQILAKSN